MADRAGTAGQGAGRPSRKTSRRPAADGAKTPEDLARRASASTGVRPNGADAKRLHGELTLEGRWAATLRQYRRPALRRPLHLQPKYATGERKSTRLNSCKQCETRMQSSDCKKKQQ